MNHEFGEEEKPRKSGSGGARPGAGKPPYIPTPADAATVKAMLAAGFRQEEIAMCLGHSGISSNTMRKHFPHELKAGKVQVNSLVARGILKKALDGNLTAQIFWCKTRMHWRENDVDEKASDRLHELVSLIKARPGSMTPPANRRPAILGPVPGSAKPEPPE
jgi:hypothetical protein